MARVAAIAWMLAAAIVAGLVLYLAAEEAATCAGDPAVRLRCEQPSLAEVVATPLMRFFLWPVWAPLLLLGYLLARHPTRGRAMFAAGAGIVGGVAVVAVITLLAHPDGSPTWDRPAVAFGLLLCIPGLLSGLAAVELHPPRQHSIPATEFLTHYVSLPSPSGGRAYRSTLPPQREGLVTLLARLGGAGDGHRGA